jgi:hypothetical protein
MASTPGPSLLLHCSRGQPPVATDRVSGVDMDSRTAWQLTEIVYQAIAVLATAIAWLI